MSNVSSPNLPEVSVVIPTYNDAVFLEKALSSLVKQTFQNWEALVIDNESFDNTAAVIKSFCDKRIKSYSIQNSGIIGASRNLGINKAKAKYVAFLDSDDVWFPTKLEICVKKLNEGYDLLCHAEEWFNDRGRIKLVFYGPESSSDYKSLLYNGNKLSTSAILVRRCCLNVVGGFSEDPKHVTAEDYDLWMRLAKKPSKFIFIPDVLGAYRVHAKGNSRLLKRHRLAEYDVVRNHHLNFAGKSQFLFKIRVLRILTAFLRDACKKMFERSC